MCLHIGLNQYPYKISLCVGHWFRIFCFSPSQSISLWEFAMIFSKHSKHPSPHKYLRGTIPPVPLSLRPCSRPTNVAQKNKTCQIHPKTRMFFFGHQSRRVIFGSRGGGRRLSRSRRHLVAVSSVVRAQLSEGWNRSIEGRVAGGWN